MDRQLPLLKTPLAQAQAVLKNECPQRRLRFRREGGGDDNAGDAMPAKECRQVAQAAQNHVPMDPFEMERRLVVNQPDDHPPVKTAGVVKAAFLQKKLAAPARSI